MSLTTTTTLKMAGRPFTIAAVNFLVTNAGFITANAIANRLGRTTKAIRRKAEKLNISLALLN